jgi:hypothetical protein
VGRRRSIKRKKKKTEQRKTHTFPPPEQRRTSKGKQEYKEEGKKNEGKKRTDKVRTATDDCWREPLTRLQKEIRREHQIGSTRTRKMREWVPASLNMRWSLTKHKQRDRKEKRQRKGQQHKSDAYIDL